MRPLKFVLKETLASHLILIPLLLASKERRQILLHRILFIEALHYKAINKETPSDGEERNKAHYDGHCPIAYLEEAHCHYKQEEEEGYGQNNIEDCRSNHKEESINLLAHALTPFFGGKTGY